MILLSIMSKVQTDSLTFWFEPSESMITEQNHCWALKGLYVLRAWIRPSTDPAAETSDTARQAQLNIFREVHLKENFGIFVLAIYISTGK